MAQSGTDLDVEIPAFVSKMVRAVLLSSVKGVLLKKFSRDYSNLVGEPFPWKRLGFTSAVSLLKAIPSVVRFEFSQKDGDYRLYGIGDDQMFMPSWVIKAQGKAGVGSDPPLSNPTPTGRSTSSRPSSSSARELVYSARGLVTIYVSWCDSITKKNASSCDVHGMKSTLHDFVAQVTSPVEVFVHPNAHAFVRFSTIEKAKQVLQHLHKSVYHGYQFSMAPAVEKMSKGTVKPARSKKQIQQSLQEAMKKQQKEKLMRNSTVNSSSKAKCLNGESTEVSNSSTRDNRTSHNPQQLYRFRGLIEELAVSDCGSDGSSFEWDDDLLDNLIPVAVSSHANSEQVPCSVVEDNTTRPTFNESGLIPVTVSQVHSPDNLWIQLSLDPERECEHLSAMIAHNKPSRLDKCQIGSFCCVRDSHMSTRFMRMRVEGIRTNSVHKQVNILCIDTGEKRIVPQENVHVLPPSLDIQLVPPLAVPCALHGILSTHCNGDSWFPLDIQLLWKHLYRKKVYAKIVKRPQPAEQKPGVVELYFDPYGTQSVSDALVEEGICLDYASSSESECEIAGIRSKGEELTKYISDCSLGLGCSLNGSEVEGDSDKVRETLGEHSLAALSTGGRKVSPWKRLQTVYGIAS